MLLTESQRYRARKFRNIFIAGIILGFVYVVLSDGFKDIFPFINGLIVSILLAAVIGMLELYVFPATVNRLRFSKVVGIKLLIYFLTFSFVYFNTLVITRMIRYNARYEDIVTGEEFIEHMRFGDFKIAFMYIFIAALFIIVGLQVSVKLGKGTLMDIILGTYRNPVELYRVVMFLRVKNVERIVARIGMQGYYRFLNDFYYDISEPMIQYKGHIYQYSTSEGVVINWNRKNAFRNAGIVRMYFAIMEKLRWRKEHYMKSYGFLPHLSAGVHCGNVIISEVGDVKMDIVYHGDIINTAARITEISVRENYGLLISEACGNDLVLPVIFQSENIGGRKLTGKTSIPELIHITEKEI